MRVIKKRMHANIRGVVVYLCHEIVYSTYSTLIRNRMYDVFSPLHCLRHCDVQRKKKQAKRQFTILRII